MTGKLAGVDLRKGEYIVSTYSKTSAGFWVLDGTPTRVPQESPADELGAVIRTALDHSREGIDTPGRDGKPAQPLLDLLGLPDYATYAKGTRSVEVYVEPSAEGEAVEVTPQRNEGSRDEGFHAWLAMNDYLLESEFLDGDVQGMPELPSKCPASILNSPFPAW